MGDFVPLVRDTKRRRFTHQNMMKAANAASHLNLLEACCEQVCVLLKEQAMTCKLFRIPDEAMLQCHQTAVRLKAEIQWAYGDYEQNFESLILRKFGHRDDRKSLLILSEFNLIDLDDDVD